ncbi:MAG: HEAT repeat domain-containing protein [Nanoarchaeota archaeon]|nr:HEAT repeat domain-containing protein [Nanoarchaeota archaeon]
MVDIKARDLLIKNLFSISEKSYRKIQIMFELMNIADEKSLEGIIDILRNDTCELVRHEAAFCLGEMSSFEAVKVLKEVLEKEKSDVVIHECLMSLGVIGNEDDIGLIENYLSDEREIVSSSAEIAKERIQLKKEIILSRENKNKLISQLLDFENTSRNDRILIIFQLMNLADDDCIEALCKVLKNDPCEIVRHEAVFVLGEIGSDKCVYYLERAIENEESSVVIHEGLFALGTSGKKGVIPFLTKYLDNDVYIIAESAKIAIDRVRLIENPYSGKKAFE